MSNGRFNVENYITVKQRKQMFYNDFPRGVIIPELISEVESVNEFVVFRAGVWKEVSDYRNNLKPDAIGYSYSKAGGRQADQYAWTENCEESAIGRALDNLGYATDLKCSREEIEKVQYMESIKQAPQALSQTLPPPAPPKTRALGEKDTPKQKSKEDTKQENVSMIKEGQIEGIKKSLSYLATKGKEQISVDEFLSEHMKLDKKLEDLTFQEGVNCMKTLNKMMADLVPSS